MTSLTQKSIIFSWSIPTHIHKYKERGDRENVHVKRDKGEGGNIPVQQDQKIQPCKGK